ncbi:exopolysaccharide biosynthesis polyisoprenyl-phosphate hexose-1-phosphate transferase EpsZ [Stigmatella aurantiaca]|uniref:Exopolysaccharide biosynthesis polyprenyl glycosylphosphotransferase n=1 Tax=Stigmatella aurantiaca (strain DW4/3-1) TaxID=378806 RepID=Q08U12_STIAD|nr:exopolysaccharide biosynthesis polyisoprenyl-phosphate hexose-1-phosphate transferase EpsZ [Stigmatella aurantiaca]ADO75643.1 Exopolysaccharide biosynthesis polyprenyl glycosylphosphotransferase [Stigmatella aurantiaca DW4/3-1]EAU63976.1 galactosyl transferase CpsE [Stigmatella aurantiaca DW4/3-1]
MQTASVPKESAETSAPSREPNKPAIVAEAPRVFAAPMRATKPVKGRLAPGFAAKLNLLADLAWVVVALLGSTLLAGHSLQLANLDFWLLLGVAGLGWVLVGTTLCLYDARFSDRAPLDDLALTSITVVVITGVLYLERLLIAGGMPVVALTFFPLMLWTGVVTLRHLVFRRLAVREEPLDEALILGIGAMGRLTGEHLAEHGRRRVCGYLAFNNEVQGANSPQNVLGKVEQLEEVLARVPVDVVYISGNVQKHATEMQASIKLCERFGVPFALPAHPFRMDRARPEHGHAVADGYLHFVTHAPQPHQMAIKRLFDITSSSAALLALSPLLLTVALLIKITSRGPVLFKQKRVGLHGKPFSMLKFRSMVVNAEELKARLEAMNEQSGPVFKIKNDPRITRVGRFIRKYSIDELPQLLNVLRGEMSVVGPRPPLPNEVAKYAAWQRRRLSVRPGLTCIWQVSGRNQISFEEWMYLDMQYIDHWTLRTDLDLILKTVPVVLTGNGAS